MASWRSCFPDGTEGRERVVGRFWTLERDPVRVALLELPARFGAIDEALTDVERLVLGEGAAPADLVLLPEASLTGYVSPSGSFDVRPFAEPIEGPTRRAMAAIARRANAAIAFPLIEQAGKTY